MLEFNSQTRQPVRLMIPFLALGVIVIAGAALFFYARHQKTVTPAGAAGPLQIEGIVRAGDTNFEYYKSRVKIEKVRASLSITFSKARVATVSGLIVNDGDRHLEAVEMKIALYDVYGKLSKEKTAFALRPGLGIAYTPMEPLESRFFAINVENIEQLWNPQHVEYEVTGLRFH